MNPAIYTILYHSLYNKDSTRGRHSRIRKSMPVEHRYMRRLNIKLSVRGNF